jgi:hypothetical protein
MLKRLCVALVLGLLAMGASIQGVAADPIRAKNSFAFSAMCDGQTVQFVVIGAGDFTPGHVVGSTAVFVPEIIDITFQFTPTGEPTQTETLTRSKQNVRGDVTCTFDVTQMFPEGTFRVFGTVTGFFTPAA